MIDFDPLEFENEIKRLKPGAPSRELMARLAEIRPGNPRREVGAPAKTSGLLARLLHFYWMPAAAALVIGAIMLSLHLSSPPVPPAQKRTRTPGTVAGHPIRPDEIEIDQELVTAFDAIARLPGDVPVRFHCREWRDEIVLRDSARGVVIERQAPRLEVVPVRFETY